MTGWQVVRASDAHSWVEAWLDGRGWTTFDPTPPDPNATGSETMSRLSMYLDAADQMWQDWVVSYDTDRQIALFTRMRESSRQFRFPSFDNLPGSFGGLGQFLTRWGAALGGIALAFASWMLAGPSIQRWWQHRAHARRVARGQMQPSDATILYERFLRLLEKRGVRKPPWLTPLEFVRVLTSPDLAALAAEATAAYNDLRFGGRAEAAARLTLVIAKIERL
jgi:hypothetical protein